jgi:hypothetical protein
MGLAASSFPDGGDTSFITTTGETRVVPEALETTWEKLAGAFKAG